MQIYDLHNKLTTFLVPFLYIFELQIVVQIVVQHTL
nr:MAG TPA: hypothetical protein [Caudoviricetes sp.]